jgi:hypothetical protein
VTAKYFRFFSGQVRSSLLQPVEGKIEELYFWSTSGYSIMFSEESLPSFSMEIEPR